MERKLATVEQVLSVKSIPGADKIEIAQIKGWQVVIKKGEFSVGDLCIYCEIDSFLPIKPEFEFLRKLSYKKLPSGEEGFRLRTVKLRGQLSQGLALPVSILDCAVEIGLDVTEKLRIVKYEAPTPDELKGHVNGVFPSFIPKTGGERIQNIINEYDSFKAKRFRVTEKLDGCSATYYLHKGSFGVCSRNWDLIESQNNTFWKIARELNIEDSLRKIGKNIAIQGEIIGEGIQGNPYKLKSQQFRCFSAYLIDDHRYASTDEITSLIPDNLATVPVIACDFQLPDTINDLLDMADGKSEINPETDREGLFLHSDDLKFKVISNSFLLNEGE